MGGIRLALWWDWRGICEEQVLELRRKKRLPKDAPVPTDLSDLLHIEVAGVAVDVDHFLNRIEWRLRAAAQEMAEAETRRVFDMVMRYPDPKRTLEVLISYYDGLGMPPKRQAEVVKLPTKRREQDD